MSRRCAVRVARIMALLGVSASAFSATAPTAADLARCAAIAAPGARLACYDALAGRAADRAAPAAAAAPTPAPTAPTPAPTAPTPAPASTFASDPRNFGFTEAQQHTPAQAQAAPQAPAAIQARITNIIDNRLGRAVVVLDNGQTWTFVDADDDARLSPGDPVTIKRGSLGSFLLLTPSKHSYHVHRTQ